MQRRSDQYRISAPPQDNHAMKSAGLLLIPFLSSLLLAAAAVPLVRRVALRVSLMDDPSEGAYKTHPRPVPYGGGIAIFAGAALPLIALLVGFVQGGLVGLAGGEANQVTSLLLCASAVFTVGLIDDWRGLSPLLRLAVQAVAALYLVSSVPGFRLTLFTSITGPSDLISGLTTVIWIVALTNAFNFLDNMDGLSAGLAVIGLSVAGLLAVAADHWPAAALCLSLAGASAGFLLYNFPPASVFMGDAGGLFLGFAVGAATALISNQLAAGQDVAAPSLSRGVAPLIVLGVPLYDLVTVVLIRLKRRIPLWRGDTNHISHRLVRLGLSRRGSVLSLYGLATLSGITSLVALFAPPVLKTPVLLGAGAVVAIGACLDWRFSSPSLSPPPGRSPTA